MAEISTTLDYLASLDWCQWPQHGGQIVEVSYACDDAGVWEWKYDRSDQTSWYRFAAYRARATDDQLAFEPQNSKLPRHNQWHLVVVQ